MGMTGRKARVIGYERSEGARAMEAATFGAGCFWHVEEEFAKLPGVISTKAGFMGGTKRNPTYGQVCTGRTGHAEVVRVEFDPGRISYRKLLDAFWGMHDPTQSDGQGPDIGRQYRSVIFYHTDKQRKEAERSRSERRKRLAAIATEIAPASVFWQAEERHQRYFEKQGAREAGASA